MVGVDFALVGLLIATSAWFLAKRFLRGRRTVNVSLDMGVGVEELEFGYCFDVHCNAFFPVFVWLYVVQYLIMPLLIKDYWYLGLWEGADGRISIFLGNTLYAVALIYYTYITFLGYNCNISFQYQTDYSASVSTRDSAAVDSYPCNSCVIYYQSVRISCLEAGC